MTFFEWLSSLGFWLTCIIFIPRAIAIFVEVNQDLVPFSRAKLLLRVNGCSVNLNDLLAHGLVEDGQVGLSVLLVPVVNLILLLVFARGVAHAPRVDMPRVLPHIICGLSQADCTSHDKTGFFFHGSQKTQGEINSSPEKTQAIFGPKTQGTRGYFENLPTKTPI